VLTQSISYRVYYEDTDAGGIVYHANYLKFAERARTEWLRLLGFEQSKLMLEEKILLPVYHLEISFLSPAKLDDLLHFEIQLLELKYVSMKLRQHIKCENRKLAELDVTIACVNLEKKPTRLPKQLYEALQMGVRS
jgi:acyl-CoA thioester hydrolase